MTEISFDPQNEHPRETDRIVDFVVEHIRNRYQFDIRDDEIAMERIQEAAARAARELTTSPSTRVHIPYLSVQPSGPIHLQLQITAKDLDGEQQVPSRPKRSPADQHADDQQRVRVKLPSSKPYLTFFILGLTILVYLTQIGSELFLGYDLPAEIGVKNNLLIEAGEYWRLLTPMLLHGSILHIGFNMYALIILGQRIERLFGPGRFLLLYVTAGLAGNVFSFYFTQAPSLGSSTAIFGLLGAEGVFIYQHQKLFGRQFNRQLWQIVQVAIVNILIGLSPGIDNWGHIGGLLGGMIFTFFAGPAFRVEGIPPLVELVDEVSENRMYLTAGLMAAVLIGLVGIMIYFRS